MLNHRQSTLFSNTLEANVPHSVGDLRLRLPRANDPYEGSYNATTFGPSCIQQPNTDMNLTDLNSTAALILQALASEANVTDDEDCKPFKPPLNGTVDQCADVPLKA